MSILRHFLNFQGKRNKMRQFDEWSVLKACTDLYQGLNVHGLKIGHPGKSVYRAFKFFLSVSLAIQ